MSNPEKVSVSQDQYCWLAEVNNKVDIVNAPRTVEDAYGSTGYITKIPSDYYCEDNKETEKIRPKIPEAQVDREVEQYDSYDAYYKYKGITEEDIDFTE